MFRHLKYIDGNSDKFWQIEQEGNTHTVTYGKNGTSGQSKTKTFDSEEASVKDAEKLTNEKIKKGYSDDGTVVVPNIDSSAKRSGTGFSSSQQAKLQLQETLRTLIKSGKAVDVLPFLKEYSKGNLELLKKEIKQAKKYWMSYVDLSNDAEFRQMASHGWGKRGTNSQEYKIKLLALGTFSLSDSTTWSEFVDLLSQQQDPILADLLDWAKPDWLAEYLKQQYQKNDWNYVAYSALRKWEAQGLLAFEEEVYARSLTNYHQWRANEKDVEKYVRYLLDDPLTVSRDIPLLFAYETNIQNIYLHFDYQSKENVLFWDQIFDHMLSEGKVDKRWLFISALEAQTKSWNPNLRSYFRKLIERLNVENEMLLQEQTAIFPLLHAELPAVVNFAVELLKPLLLDSKFDLLEFENWLAAVFMRADVKKSIKTLLIQFDKILKIQVKARASLLLLVSDVFMVPELQLQERAVKLICKYGDTNDADLSEKLSLYSDQLLGNLKDELKPFLSDDEGLSLEEVLAPLQGDVNSYLPQAATVPVLEEILEQPQDWSGILFQVGKVLGDNDSVQMEILVNAWMIHRASFPDDYKVQLEPYTKQLNKTYRESAWFHYFSNFLHAIYYNPEKISLQPDRYMTHSKTVAVLGNLLLTVQRRMLANVNLPLLSLPTHAPCYVNPLQLVERLLQYEKAEQAIDLLDFSVAVSRMPRVHVEAAWAAAQSLQDGKVKDLLRYALGLSDELLVDKKSWLQKLLPAKQSNDSLWAGIWATAARTHHPNGNFEQLAAVLNEVPFAVAPFRPEPKFESAYYMAYNYATKKQEPEYLGEKLLYALPTFGEIPATFLYGKDLFFRGKDGVSPYYIYGSDVAYMYSLMPQNPEALALFLTSVYSRMNDYAGKSSSALLHCMLHPSYVIDLQSSFYLATCCFNKEKEVRIIAGEVLLHSVEQGRLQPSVMGKDIGFLISHNYGPLGRLIDVLAAVKDISPSQTDALRQVLEATFIATQLGEKPPLNLKKLLEMYFDVKSKSISAIGKNVLEALQRFETVKSLQSILKKIRS
ncbi:DUF6493 family protein [Sphingobacterium bambusae]|uniref:DUF6493 family protein n=1 Tax=Sphingobacterium bambusae TaxID=662858 RepID=A0ABW6BL29_9SPHI|nr:DUF6493 family protein [Sphingobacterium bambusae]WPL48145.1 DUF6493 family protein [Sphingobacterium bambusae]